MPTLIANASTAAVAALKRAPAVCPEVSRGRRRQIALEVDAAVVVRPVQAEVTQALPDGKPVAWQTSMAVECYARSGASVDPDTAIDGLLGDVYARLMEDQTLGGAVVSIKPQGIGYDFDADGQQTTCATLVFNILHRTAGNTLT